MARGAETIFIECRRCGHKAQREVTQLPLPAGATDFARWRGALMIALRRIAEFAPDAVVVALGVDTFEGDPISGFALTSADYVQLGRDIASMRLPVVITLEGGYAVETMGINVVNVFEGFASAAPEV
jgi:acetoin utilization deacetylase AcuC-like enzyme